MRRLSALCVLVVLAIGVNSPAQVNPALVGGMKWRQIGPFRGGRVLAVAGVPGDPNTYYFGSVAGGIFKSTNGGLSWTPTFDHEDISSIGAIAVADSDHNILYAGSGEANIRGNVEAGDGIYKSVDAGKTWAPRVGPSTHGIRKDAGVGVLIESTRAALLRVIRVEVAFPDRGGKAVFLISGSSLF